MSKTAIVIDSGLDIPAQLLEQYNIAQVPVLVYWKGRQHRDKTDLTLEQMFDGIAAGEEFPTTSQPSPGEFLQVFRTLAFNHDTVLSFHLGSGFSGTYSAACSAAAMIPRGNVQVVDTGSISMGGGWQALAAAKVVARGGDAQAAKAAALRVARASRVKLVLDTLEFVRRGGRISTLEALLGSLLNIKPMLEVTEGRLRNVARARSRKRSLAMLFRSLTEDTIGEGNGLSVAVGHARADADQQWMVNEIKARYPKAAVLSYQVGVGIGTHGGPGVLGICYYQI